jgi:hypothetical protein
MDLLSQMPIPFISFRNPKSKRRSHIFDTTDIESCKDRVQSGIYHSNPPAQCCETGHANLAHRLASPRKAALKQRRSSNFEPPTNLNGILKVSRNGFGLLNRVYILGCSAV